jgi:cell division septal protein FtsQ
MVRKKIKIIFNFIPVVIIIIISLGLILFISNFLQNSVYFRIKQIICSDQNKIDEINKFLDIKNRNIFSVSPMQISKKLKEKFPEFAEIKVLREFPDSIIIKFIKRVPIAEFSSSGDYFVIDDEGIVLGYSDNFERSNLTTISGLDINFKNLKSGQRIKSRKLNVALSLLRQISNIVELRRFRLSQLDVSNLNKIYFFINNTQILIRKEDFDEKLKILVTLLRQLPELDEINYIDLRFKDPVIKKR